MSIPAENPEEPPEEKHTTVIEKNPEQTHFLTLDNLLSEQLKNASIGY